MPLIPIRKPIKTERELSCEKNSPFYFLLFIRRHEAPDELRNLIRGGIEREMARIEDVDLGLRYVLAVAFRLPKVEREIILTPNHQQAWLLLAHPSLPLGVSVDVRAIVVEEVALNVGLAGLVKKGKF